jgi:hypothetical protein
MDILAHIFLLTTLPPPLGSFCVSAPCYRGAEYVGIITVVITPFELGNIQREVFAANLVIAAHDAALQERPETVNRLRMNNAINVLPSAVSDRAVLFQLPIAGVLVSRDEANFCGDRFADKGVQRFGIGALNDAGDNIAFALDRTDDNGLTGAASSRRALVSMAVLVFATYISFIDFDDAHELAEIWISKTSANAVAHIVSGRIGAKTKHPVNLQCGNALLAGQHQIDDFEPCLNADVGVFEDRSNEHREAIASCGTSAALPVKRTSVDFSELFIATARATDANRPATRDQVGFTGVIGREQFFELLDGHLVGEFGHRRDSLA